jgi:hypothetical protein
MRLDEPRQHGLARDVDNAASGSRRRPGGDRLDFAVRHDYGTAFDHVARAVDDARIRDREVLPERGARDEGERANSVE